MGQSWQPPAAWLPFRGCCTINNRKPERSLASSGLATDQHYAAWGSRTEDIKQHITQSSTGIQQDYVTHGRKIHHPGKAETEDVPS